MWKKILSIAGALAVLGAIATVGWVLDGRYAKAEEVKQNKTEIRINTLKDDIRWYQDQMFYLMNRCGVRNPEQLPEHAYETYIIYQNQKDQLDKELQIEMEKK